VFILNGGPKNDRSPLLLSEFEFQRFPVTRLISESPIVIGLLQLFCKKCEEMEKLVSIFSDAVNATRQRRTEDAFRYIGTGLEKLLPSGEGSDFNFSGASALLVFEKIRAQFEWLNRRVVPYGKSRKQRKWENHMIILNDEQWNEYVREENIRTLPRLHRETFISYLKNSSTIFPKELRFFESILSCLRMRRNQLAHQAESYKDDYFLPIALDYFRTALQFRFHCYLIWLEWNLGSKLQPIVDNKKERVNFENFFPEGWIKEFAEWAQKIPGIFEEISKDAFKYRKSLCLGAGFSGLFTKPLDKEPIKPLSLREDKSVYSILKMA
jgi:hypothetical protein